MKSLWKENLTAPEFPTLTEDCKTDVLIIGAGITGILTGYFLEQKGINYIIVEKNRICSGVTENTTAKITFQHNLIYDKIIKSYGINTAQGYLQANQKAFDEFRQLCSNIDCDYEIKNNYVYSLDNRKKIEKEITALNKIGYNASFFEDAPLPFQIAGAVCFPDQAQFHPLKFLYHISENLNIYENTFVKEMIGNTAVTEHSKIKADKIIVTTHFPFINKHGAYFLKLYQDRSYVIAIHNAQDVNGMYIDENSKGLSFRNYDNLLLLGGGAHRTGKNGGNWNELRNFAKRKYPQSTEKYYWAAQDCMSLDNMPYIGHYSKGTPNLYTASGFNKWGMTGAMLSAKLLSDEIMGIKNEYAEIFSPSRSIIKPQLFVNAIETTANLLTLTNKRCPHLGCALKWNRTEHSWDCPCHGSRFAEDGTLLNNPANGNLEV